MQFPQIHQATASHWDYMGSTSSKRPRHCSSLCKGASVPSLAAEAVAHCHWTPSHPHSLSDIFLNNTSNFLIVILWNQHHEHTVACKVRWRRGYCFSPSRFWNVNRRCRSFFFCKEQNSGSVIKNPLWISANECLGFFRSIKVGKAQVRTYRRIKLFWTWPLWITCG